jgi:hypothetical protein
MKRHVLLLAGMLALCAALPVRAQQLNSQFNGEQFTSQLPFGASSTPTLPQITGFLSKALSSASSFFSGLAPQSTTSTTQTIVQPTGGLGQMYIPTSGPIVAPYPEQFASPSSQFLGANFGFRQLIGH